jgi:hypothetical protein
VRSSVVEAELPRVVIRGIGGGEIMKSGRTLQSWLVGVVAVCLLTGNLYAFDNIYWGVPGVYDPYAPCPGPDTPGGTVLRELTYLPGPSTGILDAFLWQFSGPNRYTADGVEDRPPEEEWTFDVGGTLHGDLCIDIYEAYDRHHGYDADGHMVWDPGGDWCRHGAHLSASYLRDPLLDPVNLAWVQVFVASYDKHGVPAGTPLADPFFNDGTDDAPFYFCDLDDPLDFYRGDNLGADLIFGDTPGASHLESEPFHVSLNLYLFLSAVDPLDPHHLFIYDGISWGYEGVCVPAPAALLLALIGVHAVVALRRRGALS